MEWHKKLWHFFGTIRFHSNMISTILHNDTLLTCLYRQGNFFLRGSSPISVKHRKIDILETRAFSRHQDVRLLRSSINFEILPKQEALEVSRAENYRQNSRKRSILPVFRAKTGSRRGLPSRNYRQTSRKRSILSVFRAKEEKKYR